ncbi:MAG: hypothetical protein M1816_005820 [Peltula sp. TS41687]|nr:MAG: hypothetical protein M1816_005820 [Peltula sp. TS41687]
MTSVLIWTSPTLGLPRPHPHPELSNGDLRKIGGITFDRGPTTKELKNAIGKLSEQNTQSTIELRDAIEELGEQNGQMTQQKLDGLLFNIKHRLQAWHMVNDGKLQDMEARTLEKIRQGRSFRKLEDVKQDFDKLPPKKRICVYNGLAYDMFLSHGELRKEILTSVKMRGTQEFSGGLWDHAILVCGLSKDLLLDPKQRYQLPTEDVAKTMKEEKEDGDHRNESKSNFASVKDLKNLIGNRARDFTKTVGGALLKAQSSSTPVGMPAGMPARLPSLGGGPVGVL